jgi:hypothetical protein
MKKIIILFIMIQTLNISFSHGTQLIGKFLQETASGSAITHTSIYIISDSQDYTGGGLTFSYPADLFNIAPVVQVSIQQNTPHATNMSYVAEISSNNPTETTVMVYEVHEGIISQAPTSSVTVNLFAVTDCT